MLVAAVVIHDPNFFAAGAGTDERDLRRGDAGLTGEFTEDLIGELMREFADLRVGGCTAVDLADHGLSGAAVDVVEPGLNFDFGGGFGEITEGNHVRIDLRIFPFGVFQFTGNRGDLLRIETRAYQFEDAAESEIVANDLRESERMRFGLIIARSEGS